MQDIGIQVLSLDDLTRLEVECLLDRCLDGEHKFMDDYTFCLFDVSEYGIEGFQSILIQKNGDLYASQRTTNHLLKQYAKELNHIHEQTCLIASVLEFHQKIPYVIGERCIIPLDGYTKKPTTWIVANHVMRMAHDRVANVLYLTNRNQLVLGFALSKAVFEDQVLRAVKILKYKLILHNGQMREYQYAYRSPQVRPLSILTTPFEESSIETPELTYFEVEMKVREHLEKQRVKRALGEGNPYYEDYIAQFL